ncbi:hypothetical protein DV515_00012373 [Chloebia gouldiae]|uniref:Uncharacterized protein n=1 Tax=Chloebia gouldiae TaxID=44316 RepID=A0A3L8S418_CHLGU|nr:hypothetical protein DV515_00012373 [Chloebia gouldiae]
MEAGLSSLHKPEKNPTEICPGSLPGDVVFLKAIEDFLLLSDWIDGPESPAVLSSLIHTIDTVMAHLSHNLEGSSEGNSLPLTLEGSSAVAVLDMRALAVLELPWGYVGKNSELAP